MIARSETIQAATAKTIDLTKAVPADTDPQRFESIHRLVLSNANASPLYAVFNWETGATEVSATNLHVLVPAGGVSPVLEFGQSPTNMRVISAGAGALGLLGH